MHENLVQFGYAWVKGLHSIADLVKLGNDLGQIIDCTNVRLKFGCNSYLAMQEKIPFHTDHPRARYVIWLCLAQDQNDGANLLIDGYEVISRLSPEVRSELTRTFLFAAQKPGSPVQKTSILYMEDNKSIFFAPWLKPSFSSDFGIHSVEKLSDTILKSNIAKVTLNPGDILIVNNRRMLHARDKVCSNSARHLKRLWIA